jgi:hypothetical protein
MTSLKDAIRAEFSRVLLERKLTVTAAARQLGVSRQAFHGYLSPSAPTFPRPRVLAKAMQIWDLRLDFGGASFSKDAFPPSKNEVQPASQRSLWEKLDSITQDDLRFTVKRVGKSLRVAVHFDIPA